MSSQRISHILQHLTVLNQSTSTTTNAAHSDISLHQIKHKIEDMIGKELGTSSWIEIIQRNVDTFAKITDADWNYIHQKDSKQRGSPFGPPIAQGMYILALLDSFIHEILSRDSNVKLFSSKYRAAGINQGFNKVRFIAPSYIGNKVRGIFKLKSVTFGKKENSIRFVFDVTVQTKDKKTQQISNVAFAEFVSVSIYAIP
eukprot:538269_1